MKLFSHNETNLRHNEIHLNCKSAENSCAKPLLKKRKGTQVTYQYLRSNLVRSNRTRFAFSPLGRKLWSRSVEPSRAALIRAAFR